MTWKKLVVGLSVAVVCVALVIAVLCGFKHHKVHDREVTNYKEAVTVVMPTYDRPLNIVQDTIREYEAMDVVDKVIVLEFTTGKNRTGHPNAVLLPNDLRYRFSPESFSTMGATACPHVASEAMFITDDDCICNERLVRSLVGKMRAQPQALHGIEGRILDHRGNYMAVHRPRVAVGGRKVPVLLTWCVLAKTDTMQEVSQKFEANYFDCAKPLNGEDIAISMLFDDSIMHEDGWWTWFGVPVYNPNFHFKTNVASLSSKPGFVKERTMVTRNFQRALAGEGPCSA